MSMIHSGFQIYCKPQHLTDPFYPQQKVILVYTWTSVLFDIKTENRFRKFILAINIWLLSKKKNDAMLFKQERRVN